MYAHLKIKNLKTYQNYQHLLKKHIAGKKLSPLLILDIFESWIICFYSEFLLKFVYHNLYFFFHLSTTTIKTSSAKNLYIQRGIFFHYLNSMW